MTAASRVALHWVERGLVPDAMVRAGIRRLCRRRQQSLDVSDGETAAERLATFIDALADAPVAPRPELANSQHYELPAEFFGEVLGPQRKYSCCWWPGGVADLADAEVAALRATCERAGLADGQRILELGCGWGSLSLWLARHYPAARITAVSNSHAQRRFIEARAADLGLANLTVITADMNAFAPGATFDRVVSVEMFEHMRNWATLMRRIHAWLVPGGRFFMHVFCHRDTPYLFEDRDDDDWMSRHFFTGGMMPSADLPLRIAQPLAPLRQWHWSGRHYQRTADAWLQRMDARRESILAILAATYGEANALVWWQRWRLFFMACAETFGCDGGERWHVGHYLFAREV
jgi:cyclopropane-fatty-acyl-phospholipid synthase